MRAIKRLNVRRLLAIGLALATSAAVGLSLAPTAAAQLGGPIDLRGFSHGTVGHVTALETGGPLRLADVEVAYSSAAVDASASALGTLRLNEMNRQASPAISANTYARGTGLEVGLGVTPSDPNQIILAGEAEESAPPSSQSIEEIAVAGDPLAYASLVRGQAAANWNTTGLVPGYCVIGDDLSRALGYAADVELLDTDAAAGGPDDLEFPLLSLDDADEDRSVSQSLSRNTLVPNGTPGAYGLIAQTRQTIAPVTLFGDDDNPENAVLTIEVLGEWVLQARAMGNGSSTLHYGPGTATPDTPILRLIDHDPATDDTILRFQDLFGTAGLHVPVVVPEIGTITIGEDPRAIAAPGTIPDPASLPTITPTLVSGAVDVVRIELLAGVVAPQAVDIRVGHMEVMAQVPAGGVTGCGLPVVKVANPERIKIGDTPDTTRTTMTVFNPYNCDLANVTLVDVISEEPNPPAKFGVPGPITNQEPNFSLVDASPTPVSPAIPTGVLTASSNPTVTWDLGTIPQGGTGVAWVDMRSATKGGFVSDIATADAVLANCSGAAVAGFAVAGAGVTGVSPKVTVVIEVVTGADAAATTATGAGIALAALGLAWVSRRRLA